MSEKINEQNGKSSFEVKKMIKSNSNPKKEMERKPNPFNTNIGIPEGEGVAQQPTSAPAHEEVKPEPIKKNPYFEPNKSAKLSEDVITKVKMLTPFIHKRHGYDLRATNSFIDIALDYYAENALDENEQEDFKKIYEVMTAPKRDSK